MKERPTAIRNLKQDKKRMQEKSEELLRRAFAEVPFYRDHWKTYDPGEGVSADRRFAALPVLTKEDMRSAFPDGLVPKGMRVAQGLKRNAIEYSFTSGTTGEKVVNLWNQEWWHASEMASWQLNPHLAALSYPPRQATLASSLNVGISCEEDLPTDHRIMGNLLYLNEKANILCWRDFHMKRIAEEINAYRPTVLEANPSLLARCCFYWIDHDIEVFSPDVITFTYELPSKVSLAAIHQVFSSPCVSSYGTTETGFVMDTGEDGRYYQNTEFNRIDFLPFKKEFGGPDLGRIAVSTFGNPWACILRFDVGDMARIKKDRPFSADSIEGRTSNLTFAVDGALVTTACADDALAKVPGIRDYDLSQTDEDRYDLKLVLHGNKSTACREAKEILQELYGREGYIRVTAVDDLLPGPSGKYRRTHTEFPFDEWAFTEREIIHA